MPYLVFVWYGLNEISGFLNNVRFFNDLALQILKAIGPSIYQFLTFSAERSPVQCPHVIL